MDMEPLVDQYVGHFFSQNHVFFHVFSFTTQQGASL